MIYKYKFKFINKNELIMINIKNKLINKNILQ